MHVGGLTDVHAPFAELATLALPAHHVFIVENKQTGLAFDDLAGAVAFWQLAWLAIRQAVDVAAGAHTGA